MTRDYYAILGVTPASEDVVIRAAYRALMRRYHPDSNSSSEAAERAQAINAAYAVLSDPEQRARYDGSIAAAGLVKVEPHSTFPGPAFLRPGPLATGALALLAAMLLVIAIDPPVATPPGQESASPRTAAAPAEAPEDALAGTDEAVRQCGSREAAELIKAELFRRAGERRGPGTGAMAAVADRAMVRIESPAGKSGGQAGATGCSAWVALDLPPGTMVDGGRTNLNSEVAFALVEGAGSTLRLATLSGAGEMVRALSTLGLERELHEVHEALPIPEVSPPPLARSVEQRGREASRQSLAAAPAKPREAARADRPSRRTEPAPCAGVSGRTERALCRNPNLAALDRQLALLTGQSLSRADEARRSAISASAGRFDQARARCRSDSCLTNAYVARMREVSDIMARRPRPE